MPNRGTPKIPVTGGLVVKTYDVLVRAVQEGVAYGWNRAHKHTDKPGEDHIKDEIEQHVVSAILEYFDIPHPPEEEM